MSCAPQATDSSGFTQAVVSREAALLMAKQAASRYSVEEWSVALQDDGSAQLYVVEGSGTVLGEWLHTPVVEVDAQEGTILRQYDVMEPRTGYFSSIDVDWTPWFTSEGYRETECESEEVADCRDLPVGSSEAIRVATAHGLKRGIEPWNLILIRHSGCCKWLVHSTLAVRHDGTREVLAAVIDATTGHFKRIGIREGFVRNAAPEPATPN